MLVLAYGDTVGFKTMCPFQLHKIMTVFYTKYEHDHVGVFSMLHSSWQEWLVRNAEQMACTRILLLGNSFDP